MTEDTITVCWVGWLWLGLAGGVAAGVMLGVAFTILVGAS